MIKTDKNNSNTNSRWPSRDINSGINLCLSSSRVQQITFHDQPISVEEQKHCLSCRTCRMFVKVIQQVAAAESDDSLYTQADKPSTRRF